MSKMKDNTAKISLFQGVDKPFVISNVPIIHTHNTVLVKVSLATICGSDLHTVSGRRPASLPCILGHEVVGTVALPTTVCSTDGKPLKVGDRIAWSLTTSCGVCHYCKDKNIPQKCVDMFKYGHSQFIKGSLLSGGFATHIQLVEGTTIFHIPEHITDIEAAPINCALTTVINGLISIGTHSGETAIIHGAGMLGIYASCVLKEKGYSIIAVVDKNPDRLRTAKEFGATHTFNINNTSIDEIKEITNSITYSRGFDLGIELSGAPSAIPLILDLIGVGGRCLTLGYVYPLENIPIDIHKLVTNCIKVEGVHNYHPSSLKTALDFVSQHRNKYPFAELIGDTYPISEIDDAFLHAFYQNAIRIAIDPMKE